MRCSRRWSFRVLSLSALVLAAQAVPARADELGVRPRTRPIGGASASVAIFESNTMYLGKVGTQTRR
jgi:hypothetical protein